MILILVMSCVLARSPEDLVTSAAVEMTESPSLGELIEGLSCFCGIFDLPDCLGFLEILDCEELSSRPLLDAFLGPIVN